MARFDWHTDTILPTTPVDQYYKNTQNVRRFMIRHCGEGFHFTRDFMQWIKDGNEKTMNDVVAEWRMRQK